MNLFKMGQDTLEERSLSPFLNIQKCFCIKSICITDFYLGRNIYFIEDSYYYISNNLPAFDEKWLSNHRDAKYWVDDLRKSRLCLISEEVYVTNFLSIAKHREDQINEILN